MNSFQAKLKYIVPFIALFLTQASFAIEPDQLRGRVLSVNEGQQTLTLRVLETGNHIDAEKDVVRTFTIPRSADIDANLRTDVLDDDLGEIEATEIVTIEVDVENPGNARNIQLDQVGDA